MTPSIVAGMYWRRCHTQDRRRPVVVPEPAMRSVPRMASGRASGAGRGAWPK